MFSITKMIYFDCIILLIFLEKCDFLKLTMHGFINEYLFSYWALAHPVFKMNFSIRFVCEISSNDWQGFELRFLRTGWRVSCGMVSNDLVCKPWFETGNLMYAW